MAGGRPTLYNDEIITKTEDYIENFHKHDDLIPSLAGLSFVLGVGKSTMHDWKGLHPEFSDMLEMLMLAQEKFLLRGGLSGDMNSTITKLVLSKHNYSDKTDSTVDHTTNGKDMGTTVTFVNSSKEG